MSTPPCTYIFKIAGIQTDQNYISVRKAGTIFTLPVFRAQHDIVLYLLHSSSPRHSGAKMPLKRTLQLDCDVLQEIGHAKKQKVEDAADVEQEPNQKHIHTEAYRISEQVYGKHPSVEQEIFDVVKQMCLDVECQYRKELSASYLRNHNVMKMQSATYNHADDKICTGHFARKANDSKISFPKCLRLVLRCDQGK